MFKKFYFIVTMLIFAATTTVAEARRGGVVSGQSTIMKIADLPEVDNLKIADKAGMLGFKYSRFSIFWLPLYGSTKGQYVLYVDKASGWSYKELDHKQTEILHAIAGLTVPEESPVSVFSLFWGWLVVGPLVLLALLKKVSQSDTPPRQRTAGSSQGVEMALQAELEARKNAQSSMPVTNSPAQVTGGMGRPASGFGKRRAA